MGAPKPTSDMHSRTYSTESLIDGLRDLEKRAAWTDQNLIEAAADRLSALYYGNVEPHKLAARYAAKSRKLANCRRALRQLQGAFNLWQRVAKLSTAESMLHREWWQSAEARCRALENEKRRAFTPGDA